MTSCYNGFDGSIRATSHREQVSQPPFHSLHEATKRTKPSLLQMDTLAGCGMPLRALIVLVHYPLCSVIRGTLLRCYPSMTAPSLRARKSRLHDPL